MKRIILLLILIVPVTLMAQRPPVEDSIVRAITDAGSPYYYPNLFSRYTSGDLTLTGDDYYFLYYGYAYQQNYNPLAPTPTQSDKILSIFESNPEPDFGQSLEIIALGKEVFKLEPFNLSNLNFLTYAYGTINDTINERINSERFRHLIAAIKSSGSGLRESSPWYVLTFATSTDIIASMGLAIGKRRVVSRTVEYIGLLKDNGKVKGYFFDFGKAYWRKPDVIPDQRRSPGWEINGIKVGRNRRGQ